MLPSEVTKSKREPSTLQTQKHRQSTQSSVLNIQMRSHRHTANIPVWQGGIGLDVIWHNKNLCNQGLQPSADRDHSLQPWRQGKAVYTTVALVLRDFAWPSDQ